MPRLAAASREVRALIAEFQEGRAGPLDAETAAQWGQVAGKFRQAIEALDDAHDVLVKLVLKNPKVWEYDRDQLQQTITDLEERLALAEKKSKAR
jgi:hypothetical protein